MGRVDNFFHFERYYSRRKLNFHLSAGSDSVDFELQCEFFGSPAFEVTLRWGREKSGPWPRKTAGSKKLQIRTSSVWECSIILVKIAIYRLRDTNVTHPWKQPSQFAYYDHPPSVRCDARLQHGLFLVGITDPPNETWLKFPIRISQDRSDTPSVINIIILIVHMYDVLPSTAESRPDDAHEASLSW